MKKNDPTTKVPSIPVPTAPLVMFDKAEPATTTKFKLMDIVIAPPGGGSTPGSSLIPLGVPGKLDFFRTHPDPAYQFRAFILEDKRAGDIYLISQSLKDDLEGDISPAEVMLAANQYGELFIWIVKSPAFDGEPFATTRMEAADKGRTKWVRLRSRTDRKGYDVLVASTTYAEPSWPVLPFEDILNETFAGKYVADLSHPLIRRLRGEAL